MMRMKDLTENFSLKDLSDALQGLRFKDVTDNMPTRDQVADALGLSTSRTTDTVGAVGLFAMGLLVGAGLALLFAPKAGSELREELGERVTDLRETFSQQQSDAGATRARMG